MDERVIIIGLLFILVIALAGCTAPPTTEQSNDTLDEQWDEARDDIWSPLESDSS